MQPRTWTQKFVLAGALVAAVAAGSLTERNGHLSCRAFRFGSYWKQMEQQQVNPLERVVFSLILAGSPTSVQRHRI